MNGVIKMERDLISRALMNILDVTHFYNYNKLNNDDLYEQLQSIIETLTDDQSMIEQGIAILDKNRPAINHIVEKTNSYEEFQQLCEDLRSFKRQNGLLKNK